LIRNSALASTTNLDFNLPSSSPPSLSGKKDSLPVLKIDEKIIVKAPYGN